MNDQNYVKKRIAVLCMALVAFLLLTSCGGKSGTTTNVQTRKTISVMLQTFTGDPVREDSPVKKALEDYTNTNLKLTFVPSSSYDDKLNIAMASNQLPMIVLANSRSTSIVNAIRSGAFWEVGPLLKDYANFSKSNPIVLNNISTDGKIYGVYRSRPLGMNGFFYRKDWFDKLGLPEPKTIDEFYNMLYAFTNNDPDGDGKKDTYGMVLTKYPGSFNIISTWFGAPNGWGDDGSGKLVPACLTKEYFDTVKFFRKIHSEGLVNDDFAILDPGKWNDPVINGKAGVIVDVMGRCNNIIKMIAPIDPKAEFETQGGVEGPKGVRSLATLGYGGFFMFSKSSIKTSEELKDALAFLDKCNDEKAQNLISNGLEGRNYDIVDGYMVPKTNPLPPANDRNDFDQLGCFLPQDLTMKVKPTPIVERTLKRAKENEQIVISNPAETFYSKTYALRAPQLDTIIEDAKIKYIYGEIDDNGFMAALELWKKSGGNDYINEINEEYQKYKK